MMARILEGVDLTRSNTFGINARARWFIEARSDQDMRDALVAARNLGTRLFILGGGSNLLLTGDIDSLVVKASSRGVRLVEENTECVIVEAEAGEPWHPFVLHTLELGLGGLENLSLIPGTVGAAPIQNVGAYGVEIKDVFAGLTAMSTETGETRCFSLADCAFDYRDSRFKREPGRWIILRVRFRLARASTPRLDYGPIRQWLTEAGIDNPAPRDVSDAVSAIRRAKLPDPARLGNAGSFFKNPVVSAVRADAIRAGYPDLVAYPQPDGGVKLAAGWLIERAGWKGFRDGDAGVHRLQALVLVNHGHATGSQLLNLARRIQADVCQRFGVELEIEPNVI